MQAQHCFRNANGLSTAPCHHAACSVVPAGHDLLHRSPADSAELPANVLALFTAGPLSATGFNTVCTRNKAYSLLGCLESNFNVPLRNPRSRLVLHLLSVSTDVDDSASCSHTCASYHFLSEPSACRGRRHCRLRGASARLMHGDGRGRHSAHTNRCSDPLMRCSPTGVWRVTLRCGVLAVVAVAAHCSTERPSVSCAMYAG